MISNTTQKKIIKLDPLVLAVANQLGASIETQRFLLNLFAEQTCNIPNYEPFVIYSEKYIMVNGIEYTGFFLTQTHAQYKWAKLPLKYLGMNYFSAYIRIYQIYNSQPFVL